MKNTISLGLVLALFFAFTFSNAQELHTHSNAASINNEANSVSGWGGSALRSSDSNEIYSGNYSIKIEASSSGWKYAGYGYCLLYTSDAADE